MKNIKYCRYITYLIIYLFSVNSVLFAQVKICSWNLQNLGKSKSDSEIKFMAQTLKDFDIVALQEIVSGHGGPQAVARLAGELNRTGAKWDYEISEPTNSTPYATERYAYLWKPNKVKKIQKAFLEQIFVHQIDREPFLADFEYREEQFTVVNFHAIPKKKQPETEIKYFKHFPQTYSERNLIFLGDFNVPQTHTVFNPLKKMNYKPVFVGQKTTMKMKCVGEECLASEYDNIFYDFGKVTVLESGVVLIYKSFSNMTAVRRISDHIPIWVEFDFSGGGEINREMLMEH